MKSNLFPIWKALRPLWVLLEKNSNSQKRGKQNKNSRESDLTQPHLLPLQNLFNIYAFYCFDQPNCNCPCTGFPLLS